MKKVLTDRVHNNLWKVFRQIIDINIFLSLHIGVQNSPECAWKCIWRNILQIILCPCNWRKVSCISKIKMKYYFFSICLLRKEIKSLLEEVPWMKINRAIFPIIKRIYFWRYKTFLFRSIFAGICNVVFILWILDIWQTFPWSIWIYFWRYKIFIPIDIWRNSEINFFGLFSLGFSRNYGRGQSRQWMGHCQQYKAIHSPLRTNHHWHNGGWRKYFLRQSCRNRL